MFGLTVNRVRGLVVVAAVLAVVYFAIFESDPPPVFTEVEITIPPEPVDRFDEKTIVLPDFADSPVSEEATPAGEGVVINKVPKEETAVPVIVAPPATVTAAAVPPVEVPSVEVPSVEAPPVVPHPGFFVQVAAMAKREAAIEITTDLEELLGEATFIQEVTHEGVKLYRVRLGPYGTDEGKANEVLSRLRKQVPRLGENAFVDEE